MSFYYRQNLNHGEKQCKNPATAVYNNVDLLEGIVDTMVQDPGTGLSGPPQPQKRYGHQGALILQCELTKCQEDPAKSGPVEGDPPVLT